MSLPIVPFVVGGPVNASAPLETRSEKITAGAGAMSLLATFDTLRLALRIPFVGERKSSRPRSE